MSPLYYFATWSVGSWIPNKIHTLLHYFWVNMLPCFKNKNLNLINHLKQGMLNEWTCVNQFFSKELSELCQARITEVKGEMRWEQSSKPRDDSSHRTSPTNSLMAEHCKAQGQAQDINVQWATTRLLHTPHPKGATTPAKQGTHLGDSGKQIWQ